MEQLFLSRQLVVSPNENEDRPIHESDALLPVQIHGEITATYHRLPLRTVKQVFVEVLTNDELKRKSRSKILNLDQVGLQSIGMSSDRLHFTCRSSMMIHIVVQRRHSSQHRRPHPNLLNMNRIIMKTSFSTKN
jgi:hypothetical protein